jgi:uncharacterized protein (TIGR03435 family)
MRSATRLVLILILAASSAASGPVFEAASIRVRQGAPQWKLAISGTRLTIESYTLFGLLQEAYDLQNYEVQETGAPALMLSNDTLYDITAKAEGDGTPTRDQFRQMLQALLADRFQLKVHREPREMPVYLLVVGKGGPKFKPSLPDADAQAHFSASGPNYQATMPRESMDDLAKNLLSHVAGRPVLNKTGLPGMWDIRLTYKPESQIDRGPMPDMGEISIFTAVQDQLGLKLEPQNATIEILVVDHVEKPSEN